jgi:hypothetical protein
MTFTNYEPELVRDFASLDAAIAVKCNQSGAGPRATAKYRATFSGPWTAHCESLTTPVDPLDAPLSAFEDLLVEGLLRETPPAVSTTERLLAAVTWTYTSHGLVPAHKRPENLAQWKAAWRGYKRRIREVSGPPKQMAAPASRDDATRLLAAPLLHTPRLRAKSAFTLLALDTNWEREEISSLTISDVVLEPGQAAVRGETLKCDHRARAAGVPWDCTVCSIAAVVNEHAGPREHLFAAGYSESAIARKNNQRIWGIPIRAGAWPGLLPLSSAGNLSIDPNLSDYELAGLRRALAIQISDLPQMSVLRGRMWWAAAWSAGLRMGSDLTDVARDQVAIDRQGIRIDLGRSKTDRLGRKKTVLTFPWEIDGQAQLPASMIADYLAVRDSAFGNAAGPFLIRSIRKKVLLAPEQTAGDDIAALAARAEGITEDNLTAYSARVGYASVADAESWPIEKIQAGLRHDLTDTTSRYIGRRGRGVRSSVTKVASL